MSGWPDYNLQKKTYYSGKMHKNMVFKIHRQKLSLACQPKILKENPKTIKNKIEASKEQEKENGPPERPKSIRSMKKSKSLICKDDRKESLAPFSRRPSIRIFHQQEETVQLIDDHCADIAFISDDPTVRGLLTALIQQLTKKQLRFQALKSSFLIQKTYFMNMFECFLIVIKEKGDLQSHQSFHKLTQFSRNFQELINYCVCANNTLAHTQKLTINSSIFSQKITLGGIEPRQKITEVDKTVLASAIEPLLNQKKILQCDNLKLARQLQEKARQFCDYEHQIQQMKNRCSCLKAEVADLEARHSKAKADADDIYSYIGNQKNGILKMASADYKRIEEDLYEYASYLQANVLASGLTYEPHPYSQIQVLMKAELDELTALKEASSPSKSQRLVEFSKKLLCFLGKKDSEVGKRLEFKTNCIRTFVNNMKKWLDNWTLKQEYLNNLRVGFAADTAQFKRVYKVVQEEVLALPAKESLASLYESFCKIEENYKLGNSFY